MLSKIRLTAFAVAAVCRIACGATPVLQTLHTFTGQNGDGANPSGALTLGPAGVLYGTTASGGSNKGGTVFLLEPPVSPGGSWNESVIWSFGVVAGDGVGPLTSLALSSGRVLYGTTDSGGAYSGGTVFSLASPASPGGPWTEAVLWSFGNGTDGAYPRGSVAIGEGGILFGTTNGGGLFGRGNVFALIPPSTPGGAWTENVLWNFSDSGGGIYPDSGVTIGPGGTLYGTTVIGSAHDRGNVFSLTPPASPGGAWTEGVLYDFSTDYDEHPEANVVLDRQGNLYGTTDGNAGLHAIGTVFSVTPPATAGGAWTETVLYRFPLRKTKPLWPHGAHPAGAVMLSADHQIYGTTQKGGAHALGTVFHLKPPASPGGAWTETVLHSFSKRDGALPAAGLVMDAGGTLYGTTYKGGSSNSGTVFLLTH